jgi:hypothetical protein
MLVFDIETGPLPEERLAKLLPKCELPPHPGEFDPASVKLGNTKNETLIAEKIQAAKEKHEAAVASHDKDCEEKLAAHKADFIDKAALNAGTGQVLAVGYFSAATGLKKIKFNTNTLDDDCERSLLTEFWQCVKEVGFGRGHKLAGHNIHGFDLPFLVRRSWLLQVPIPEDLFAGNGRYWHECFVDTMRLWSCTAYNGFTKLDDLAAYLGVPGKNGNGADFHRLFKTDLKAATAYLAQDLMLTWTVAERLGVR